MDLTTIINFFKLPRKVIFLIAIISTILLFSPQSFMEKIALFQFKEKYTIWIGIVFLFTLGLSIISIFEYIKEKLNLKKLEKLESELINLNKQEYQKMLNNLDNDELINIREFYIQEKNTIQMIYDNTAVAGLVQKKVIFFVSKQGWRNIYTNGHVFIFKLSDEAKEYFNTYDFSNLDNIPRPDWINGIDTSDKMNKKIENLQNNIFNN